MLPDEVLIVIFDFCADEVPYAKKQIEAWQSLVHVCRRWRTVVFGSPRRLNLQLVCSSKTPARDTLDVWPALPLVVVINARGFPVKSVDNIVAVLERSNRVRTISVIGVFSSDLEKVLAAMQVPFPELTYLELKPNDEMVTVIPDSFLGGSARRLQYLYFHDIPFPGLPKLLLSATHLVNLRLHDIPHSGYISPETMVSALSALTSLSVLYVRFQSPRSLPDRTSRRPPPLTRFILPALMIFSFKGVSDYLEDLVSRIDAPRLDTLRITFFNQIVFDTPQFIQFISRTSTSEALVKASVSFEDGKAVIDISSQSYYRTLKVGISCRELDWQVSSLEQVCTLCLPPLSMLEDLYISEEPSWQSDWQDNIENTLWLELLLPFTSVKNLYLSEELARRIVPALQELVGGRTTEVLPALENIFLEGTQPSEPVQKGIEQCIATRQATDHPITVSCWERREARSQEVYG